MSDEVGGYPHRPVLYQEIIHALRPISGGLYVDGTLGAGGHAWGILQASSPNGRLLGLDVDSQALQLVRQRLACFGKRAVILQASYVTLREQLDRLGWEAVNGIVLDLGVSSMQIDTPHRGFSFLVDSPLDMRFDPSQPKSAADLVNELPEKELADLLYRYGEEPQSRQIARAIVQARPVKTTGQLADIISGVARRSHTARSRRAGGRERLHPATLTFQALRIAVNKELDALEQVLPQAIGALTAGGRLAVISFHSLEDRVVKQFMRQESRDCLCPPRQPICTCGHRASLIELQRQPLRPSSEEIADNPRARSARLRVAEKLE